MSRLLLVLLIFASVGAWSEEISSRPTRFEWRPVGKSELKQHFRKLMRVSEQDGRENIGMLVDVLGPTLRLRRARQDGGGVVQIQFDDIRTIEVFVIAGR